ncbi:glycosyltransferase, partial [Planctomycetota bacterium]
MGWTGWPDQKKFALVLTHDVETAAGQRQSLKLMELEERLGFCSGFYFTPERYKISQEVTQQMQAKGFEVGIHGLNHDGKLFQSEKIFGARAQCINQYLRKYGAVGFRSPAMHHNLDWIHQLDMEYDASTTDTDPFEPQSCGMSTIFPFLVTDKSSKSNYVELPYTLAQDFSLFVLMGENNIDIWKAKLDWIAARGGMALLITHPDYMNMEVTAPRFNEYPVGYYEEILNYIKEKYAGQYWHVLPREMARYWRRIAQKMSGRGEWNNINQNLLCPSCRIILAESTDKYEKRSRRIGPAPVKEEQPSKEQLKTSRNYLRVCMVAYTFYEMDNRVKRYAEALARRGDEVDVFALRQPGQSRHDTINGVNVYRIQKRIINEKIKLSYLYRILRFLMGSAVFLAGKHWKNRYDVIHVHSIPDFEVFAAWLPRWMGAKIILDIHDIVPELYASKFNVSENSFFYKSLILLEKASIAFSHHVIIANDLWRQVLTCRSVDEDKCKVFLNYPD